MTGSGAAALPVTSMIGAATSPKVNSLIAERRKIIGDSREDVFAFLHKHNFAFIPPESNKFMMDVNRPCQEAIKAMAQNDPVYIGRVWPVCPANVRVSVGTKDERERVKTSFLDVMA